MREWVGREEGEDELRAGGPGSQMGKGQQCSSGRRQRKYKQKKRET